MSITYLHSRFFYLFIILYTLIETQGMRTFWRVYCFKNISLKYDIIGTIIYLHIYPVRSIKLTYLRVGMNLLINIGLV